MTAISDLQAGKAGEYLVCADLILAGYVAFPSEQGLPFDVVMDWNDRLIRVQVKTTRTVRTVRDRAGSVPGYLFHIKRMGKGGSKEYANNHVDLFALVALDSREIGYLPWRDMRTTMILRSELLRGSYKDEVVGVREIKIREMRAQGMTLSAIGKELGLDTAYVGRVCLDKGARPARGRYLGELTLNDALSRI